MTSEVQLYRPTSALMNANSQSEITALATKLMKFPPGKDQLNMVQAAQLAVYSIMVDANPYNGEIYISDVGPQLGIPLYRRKAKEYNRAMSPSGETWGYKVNFRPAKDYEANFDPSRGDVAWVCELVDTKEEKEWQAVYAKFFNMMIEAGAPYKEADEKAMMIAGERPVWSSVGVVGGDERFSKGEVESWGKNAAGKSVPVLKKDENGDLIYKQEMYDRNERAQKRAEKLSLKKAYPDLLIPEFSEVQDNNMRVLITDVKGNLVKAEEIRNQPTTFDERVNQNNQTLMDLGFVPEPEAPPIEEGEFTDVDPLWTEPEPTTTGNIFATVTDSKGTPYSKKDAKSLSYSYTALNKKIKNFGAPVDEEAAKALDELKLKRDAVHYYLNQNKE